jgi:dihydrodipicolinate synthase/N-acetylneuraminate lyase
LLGVISNPDVRLPLTGATDEQVAVIRSALAEFGLI